MAKETYFYGKRDLVLWKKRPVTAREPTMRTCEPDATDPCRFGAVYPDVVFGDTHTHTHTQAHARAHTHTQGLVRV